LGLQTDSHVRMFARCSLPAAGIGPFPTKKQTVQLVLYVTQH